MTDEFGDKFGYLFLTLPVSGVEEGKSLVIRVTGGNQNRTSWYMTYKFPLKSGLDIRALSAIVEKGGKPYQVGKAGILHFGKPAIARIYIGNKLVRETTVKFGYNYVDAEWPAVVKPGKVGYRLELPGSRQSGTLELKPIRHWRVNFVQHSHTDIGYTRPQTEVLAEHLRYVDYALDYCDLTDTLPDAAKFRWTCEASWAVDEYLKCRPSAQVERLKKRVREGRIELTGMYFNFDELPDEQILAASLQPLKRFR